MVVLSPTRPKARLAGMLVHVGELLAPLFPHPDGAGERGGEDSRRHLGILAFEAGRTMSRLVTLYRNLSDAEVDRLCRDVVRAEGVVFLNSTDRALLLRRACAEMLDDLDAAASAVTRLGARCRGALHGGFGHVYADLKGGMGDVFVTGLGACPKDVEKKVKKMERYAASTSALYTAMEDLAELEAEERRGAGRWKQWSGQTDVEALRKQIVAQRDKVRHLKEVSLWGRSYDKVADLMARSVVSVFARICSAFGSAVSELPRLVQHRNGRVRVALGSHSYACSTNVHHHHYDRRTAGIYMSGPLERPPAVNIPTRNSGPILPSRPAESAAAARSWKERVLEPPPNTLGGSGLALRYAKVVALLEKLVETPELVHEGTRDELYAMLPDGLRRAVGAKLRCHRRMDDGWGRSEALASGWRDAADAILGWLAPMARDTLQWHSARSLEQREAEPAGPRVLMLQTLIFSDKEKAEAAVVELLVAFSCVWRYGGRTAAGGWYAAAAG